MRWEGGHGGGGGKAVVVVVGVVVCVRERESGKVCVGQSEGDEDGRSGKTVGENE